jgi:hypothetical protein
VLATTPTNTGTNVARSAKIYLTVNGNTNPGTLAGNITVTGPTTPTLTLTWNAATSAIEVLPNSALNQNATYTVNVLSGIQTVGGLAMTPASFSFTTINSADASRPTFAGGLQTITTPNTTSVVLNWNEAADNTTTASIQYFIYLATTSGFENFATTTIPPVNGTGTGTVTTTLTGLTPNITYYVVVRARDTSGNEDLNVVERTQKTLVSFSTNIYNPIVSTICTVCHSPAGADPWMDLQTGGASTVLANVWINVAPAATGSGTAPDLSACGQPGPPVSIKRVVPNDLANSLVYLKITGTQPCGVQMPKNGPFLSTTQTDLFRDWILQGANNN